MNKCLAEQVLALTVEKREQQRADVRAVHVRVCHDDYFVVAQLFNFKIVVTDACTEGGDDRADFFVV